MSSSAWTMTPVSTGMVWERKEVILTCEKSLYFLFVEIHAHFCHLLDRIQDMKTTTSYTSCGEGKSRENRMGKT